MKPLILVLLLATPVSAQSRFTATAPQLQTATAEADFNYALRSPRARKAADVTSWGLVSAEGAWYGERILRADDRRHAMLCGLGQLAATAATVRVLKAAIGRTRPDGSDDRSFPSGHAAYAALMQNRGWTGFLWPVSVGTGRVLAKKHYPTDVLGGALIGWAFHFGICPASPI
jgi:hypothetical protein